MTFLTSRFPPLQLARPLESFGASFSVELSSSLAFAPDTVLRATTGHSLRTLMRRHGWDALIKQLQYGATGKHSLSSTSKRVIAGRLGLHPDRIGCIFTDDLSKEIRRKESMAFVAQIGKAFDEVVGRPAADAGEWELLAAGLGPLSEDNPIHVLVREMAKVDALIAEVTALSQQGRAVEAEGKVSHLLKGVIGAWEVLVPGLPRRTSLLLDSTLRTLGTLERAFKGSKNTQGPSATGALALLDSSRKPLGHWFDELRRAVKCRDNLALEKYLSRTAVIRGKTISHDRLKAWASVQPKSVMPYAAMEAVVAAVPDASKRAYLQSRFLLARGLTFLADFLRSSTEQSGLSWQAAQFALAERYKKLFINS